MYMTAYQYIKNDSFFSGKLVAVADSIVDLDRYEYDCLKEEFPEEYEKLKVYRKNKKYPYLHTYYSYFYTYYSPLLAFLFRGQDIERASAILFFSNIEDLMLRADVEIYDKRYISNKFKYEQYMWGISYGYLFIFDKNATLRKVLRSESQLN
ncbi:hypothetical protein [Bacteroides sp.]|uniref:hypothetical protein n=1 Tax=Bacteroides sp. TaxID=29523 RepID=UPI00262B0865|nr:hypothetical protein [Bacteroides sp.]MDD3036925.1 hypothetical protein [Bacteroides sp.]